VGSRRYRRQPRRRAAVEPGRLRFLPKKKLSGAAGASTGVLLMSTSNFLVLQGQKQYIWLMEKVIQIKPLHDPDSAQGNVEYWLARPAAERIAAVELLRNQYYGTLPRLQRVARVVEQKRG
jgi:hypothetical protein